QDRLTLSHRILMPAGYAHWYVCGAARLVSIATCATSKAWNRLTRISPAPACQPGRPPTRGCGSTGQHTNPNTRKAAAHSEPETAIHVGLGLLLISDASTRTAAPALTRT